MKQKLLKTMLLLCALVAGSGNVWATTVTRTENFSSSSASNNQYSCGSNATTSGMQDDWDYAWSPSGNVYVFQSGIRFGTKSATGTVTNTTMLSGISTGTSITIKVYAAQWNTDGGSLVVTYNGSSTTKAPANSAITDTSNEYSSSDFSSSTNFSITKAEGITSFSIASSSKRIIIDKVEVVYDDGPAKSPNELAWSAASKSVTFSVTPYNLPTLSNPHSLAVTYESSNESVATVASDGTVTIKNVTGSTNISASTEGDATYASGTVSYTLNVTRKFVLIDGVFDFGFTTAEGGGYGSGVTQDGSLVEGSTSTWTSGNIVLAIANRYAWNSDGTLRAYKSTSSYNASEITISCPSGKAITRIDFTGPYTGTGKLSNIAANTGTYIVTSSSAIWTGASQSVTFTASNSTYIYSISVTYGTTVPITVTDAGYATYACDVPLDFTGKDIKAYIAKGKPDYSGVTFDLINKVPANTGVLLYYDDDFGGETTFTEDIPLLTGGGASDVTGNVFKRGEGAAVASESGDLHNYILNKPDAKPLGFYKANGQTVATNRAYIQIDQTASYSIKGFIALPGSEETAVEAVKAEAENGVIFNLAGQRVSKLQRGINIINGKKVVVK